MKPLRIMLVDDHQMFRDAVRSLLSQRQNIDIVAETDNGLEVDRLVRATQPDIVCMDIGMPGMNGIEATRRLLASCPTVKVIAVSAFVEQHYVRNILDAGATAYVTKIGAGDELLKAIDAVQANRTYFCPRVAALVAGPRDAAATTDALSGRERQVLQLVAEGHPSSQIAELLHIAPSTVDVHRRNIMRKLNLHSIAALTRHAIAAGHTSGPSPGGESK
jgi:DNA-binding NarL/FixJ family response regulator